MTDADLDTAFQCNMRLAAKVEALQSELATLHTRALAAEARVRELTGHRKELGDVLLRFVPGGSEYFLRDGDGFRVDPEACAGIIKNKCDRLHNALCDNVKLKRENAALAARITALTAPPSVDEFKVVAQGIYRALWEPDGLPWGVASPRVQGMCKVAANMALTAFLRSRAEREG